MRMYEDIPIMDLMGEKSQITSLNVSFVVKINIRRNFIKNMVEDDITANLIIKMHKS